jgi:uncharacterized protein YdhG (YjbR/CyaY superfamily)
MPAARRSSSAKKKGLARRDRKSGLITGAKTVEEYLAAVPEPARSTLRKVRSVIRSAVPRETTEVIGYQMPMFKYRGMLFAYAAFKDHCSLFPMGSSAIEAFKDDLKPFRTSKGTIRFALDKPFPAGLLKRLVKARVAQNELRKKS